jgi:NADPH:quinone reductase-like Zn-dependent oxidoreductase
MAARKGDSRSGPLCYAGLSPPRVPGHEIVGRIEAVGSGALAFSVLGNIRPMIRRFLSNRLLRPTHA